MLFHVTITWHEMVPPNLRQAFMSLQSVHIGCMDCSCLFTLHSENPGAGGRSALVLAPRPQRPLVAAMEQEALQDLLSWLLDGAMQRAPPGGSVHVSAQAADGGVAVSITDTGAPPPPPPQHTHTHTHSPSLLQMLSWPFGDAIQHAPPSRLGHLSAQAADGGIAVSMIDRSPPTLSSAALPIGESHRSINRPDWKWRRQTFDSLGAALVLTWGTMLVHVSILVGTMEAVCLS